MLRACLAVLATVLLFLVPRLARAESPDAGPRTVVVGTYVNQVYGVDVKGSQYSIDFYVWFRWEGEGLAPLDSFEVAGGRIVSKTGVQRKKLGTQNYASARVVATITKFWDLTRFPLDGHTLTLDLEDAEHDTRTLLYQSDRENVGLSPDLQVPGWVVRGSSASLERHLYRTNYGDTTFPTNSESHYARYRFAIEVVRPGYGRFLKVFFGLFIAVVVSWCAFWVVPRDSGPRVTLGVGATFAASAVTVTIHYSLPDTNAVTLADKLIMLSLGSIVLSVVQTIVALALFAGKREALQLRLDRACRFLFPLGYLIVLAVVLRV